MIRQRSWMAAALAAALASVIGCGGGGGGAAAGQAELRIAWPDRTRMVPAAANCVVATLKSGGSVLGSRTIVRPAAGGTTTTLFDGLPAGSATLETTAYPVADGTGTALARSVDTVTVTSGQKTTIDVSMTSTIHHLDLWPTSLSVATGQTSQVLVTAKDSAGAIVLLWPTKLRWETSNGTHATVDTGGVVLAAKPTGTTPGPISVGVTDTESGKSASIPLTVLSDTTVAVTPNPCVLSIGDSQTFAANVQNTTNKSVTWSVQEGAAGGAITSAGQYTAPAAAGTYHVIARSDWDNSKSAMATVTVQDGGLIVIIR